MYDFSDFKEHDQNCMLEFMHNNPFVFLSGSFVSGLPVATQIPLMIETRHGELFLQGHIMRSTDHHKAFVENPNVVAVFTAANTYVSASWYTNPHVGSTWNYMSVHIKGSMRIMNEDEKIQLMKKQTLHFEKGNTDSPTIYANLPEDYLTKMMPAIVGFEIQGTKNVDSHQMK